MYTVKANIPQYEPKNTPPKSLMDTLKMDKFKRFRLMKHGKLNTVKKYPTGFMMVKK